jgi:spore coat protein U-like protein
MKRPGLRLLLLAALGAAPVAARAAPTCSFAAGNPLAFGPYDPFATAPRDATSTLVYRCPPGQGVRITLDAGASGSFATRELRQGSEVLRYNLYLDAARTVVWGDGTGGSSAGPGVTSRGPGGVTTAWVFGRIFAAQDPVAGAYGDTIRVTFEL